MVTVLSKLKTPSPIPTVVKRLFPDAGRPTLALVPAPPKGVVKLSNDLSFAIDKDLPLGQNEKTLY